ncbi:hypothetical protein BDM02DRAFT_3110781 [Thelephora ganbajun]|uniref:Uncharacterized protein n=1 Tax=Thelephora ganbajun TaxID=370292 RepID=A0ACB6ZNF1_THEGA|nr:hypothetical protein BDM02DRAFT_3110781 [Thelephora ganbajun]
MKRRFAFLPLIKAVQTATTRKKVASKFDRSSVDFATDRSGLRELVTWGNSKSDHGGSTANLQARRPFS